MGAPDVWTYLSGAGGAGTVVAFLLAKEWYYKRNGNGQRGVAAATAIAAAESSHRLELKMAELYGATKNNGDVLRDIRDELRSRRA